MRRFRDIIEDIKAPSITDLAGTEDTTAICTKINALLAALRTAGILNQ